ncbi:alpha/beta hydrolase [Candidatus Latescibacterota bacterium]
MKRPIFHITNIVQCVIIVTIITFQYTDIFAQEKKLSEDLIFFSFKTYDGLTLPAQVVSPSKPSKAVIVFIMGGTPYNEKGNIGDSWDDKCQSITEKDEFYNHFITTISSLDYTITTVAKRSFVYPCNIPRPSLNDFALDIVYLIKELKMRNLLHEEDDLILVGHSEGSIVAAKVLGLLKKQPSGCVLLGSASLAFNFNTQTWEEFYLNDIMRKVSHFSDEQIQKVFELFKYIHTSIHAIDEETFENVWKKNQDPVDFAPWESYNCIKEYCYYNPVPNLMTANLPILFCVGDNDASMPLVLAQRTYQELQKNGFTKATLKVIEGEVHQYKKEDVFKIIDDWFDTYIIGEK